MNTQQFKEITNRQKELLKSCNVCPSKPELKMEVPPKTVQVHTYGSRGIQDNRYRLYTLLRELN